MRIVTAPPCIFNKGFNHVSVEVNAKLAGEGRSRDTKVSTSPFCQSGEIITFPELVIIKDNIILFLTELLLNIETYIDDKKYKK